MTLERSIGFVGLGPMGHGMARNIVAKGGRLFVMGHSKRAPVESLVAMGAVEVTTLAELAAQAEIVFLCLPSSVEVEAVVLGPDGLAAHMRPGQIIADTSTANPVSTERVAQALAGRGIGFVDAPLTRTPREAEAGTLNVILGGDDATVEQVRPAIDCFAENVFRSGPVGSAHTLKLINNFLSIGCSLVVSEAVVAAKALGVDTALLLALASQGGANSGALQMIMPWVNDGDMRFRFAVRNARKDIGYFADMLADGAGNRPVGQAMLAELTGVVAAGKGDAWMPELVDILGGAAGEKPDA